MINKFIKDHPFFFFIFFSYFFSFLFFGKLTLFYFDKLDHEIVYNSILGKFYKGDWNAANIFLNGEIKIYYLRRFLQPFSLLYIFDTQIVYWLNDVLGKILAYFLFYILSKKIIKNPFFLSLSSVFYASCLEYTQGLIQGYLFSGLPYLIYLFFFKTNIKIKHFLIVAFISLNSDINSAFFFFFFIFFFFFFFFKKKKNFYNKNFFSLLFFFYFFLILGHLNIFYSLIFEGPFNRIVMQRGSEFEFDLIFFFKKFFLNLYSANFFKDNIFNYQLARDLPIFIFKVFFYFSIFFTKEKKLFIILSIIILLHLFLLFISSRTYYDITVSIPILKIFNTGYILTYLIFLNSLISILILNKIRILYYLLIIVAILLQINSLLVPFAKNYIPYFKVENYRNYYTFEDYYLKNTYSQIKNIVKENRVISIFPIDPMVSVMNGIKVTDGYHNFYPLSYKKKFLKLIENELKQNKTYEDYLLRGGNRLYVRINDSKNPKINFLYAKKLGAEYVISRQIIHSNNLNKVAEFKDKETIYLFKIK